MDQLCLCLITRHSDTDELDCTHVHCVCHVPLPCSFSLHFLSLLGKIIMDLLASNTRFLCCSSRGQKLHLSHWAKAKVLAGLLPLEALGWEVPIFFPFPKLLATACVLSVHSPILHLLTIQHIRPATQSSCDLALQYLSPLTAMMMFRTVSLPCNLGSPFPHCEILHLTPLSESPLLCPVTFSKIRMSTLPGERHSCTQDRS